jgi:hypothetical protein
LVKGVIAGLIDETIQDLLVSVPNSAARTHFSPERGLGEQMQERLPVTAERPGPAEPMAPEPLEHKQKLFECFRVFLGRESRLPPLVEEATSRFAGELAPTPVLAGHRGNDRRFR